MDGCSLLKAICNIIKTQNKEFGTVVLVTWNHLSNIFVQKIKIKRLNITMFELKCANKNRKKTKFWVVKHWRGGGEAERS
jgi:hypothetical protein